MESRSATKEWLHFIDQFAFRYIPETDSVSDAVLSYEDFISFIRYFYGTNPLPDPVLMEIKNAEVIIFLGYRFDKWYWNLVFDMFNFPDPGDKRKVSKANFAIINQSVSGSFAGKKFYSMVYESDFENLSIEKFIDDLHNKFEKTGKLRKKQIELDSELTVNSLANQVINYCTNSELQKAIDKLPDFGKFNDFDKEYLNTVYDILRTFNATIKRYAGKERKPTEEDIDPELKIPRNDVETISARITELMTTIKKI